MGACGSKSAPAAPTKVGELTLLVIGLDNSGKSTLTAAINGDLDPFVVPTVGFAAPVKKRMLDVDLVFYDLGGGARIRGVWPNYFADVHGVVYVVDAADGSRLAESAHEMQQALLHPMVVGKPVLVFANKQDLPGALAAVDVSTTMGLDKMTTLCRHHVQACVAKGSSNGGVFDDRITNGLQWLVEAVRADYAKLDDRRTTEMAAFAKTEAERKAKQKAEYEERKAREATAAAAGAAAGGAGAAAPAPAAAAAAGDEAAAGKPAAGAPAAAPAPAASARSGAAAAASGPKPSAPTAGTVACSVCKSAPAERRSGAAGWLPVCGPCDTRLQAEKTAKQEEERRKEEAAEAAAEAAASGGAKGGAAAVPKQAAAAAPAATTAPAPAAAAPSPAAAAPGASATVTASPAASGTTRSVSVGGPATRLASVGLVPVPSALSSPTKADGVPCATCGATGATRRMAMSPGAWQICCDACCDKVEKEAEAAIHKQEQEAEAARVKAVEDAKCQECRAALSSHRIAVAPGQFKRVCNACHDRAAASLEGRLSAVATSRSADDVAAAALAAADAALAAPPPAVDVDTVVPAGGSGASPAAAAAAAAGDDGGLGEVDPL